MPKTRLYVVPHTHYDAEVFITRDVTLRLGADNLLDVLYLLDRQPEFRFVLDQRCYAEGFEQLHPEQMAALHRFAKAGRLEIAGGMHVMPDANLPSGESLVRQILYGRAYLDALSGSRSTIGWMLDSFGHHPQMPQIMRLGGFDTYIMQRGVAEYDRPSAFWWKGIDGSTIRAEWLPHTYALLYQVPGSLPAFAEALDHIRQTIQPYIYHDQYMVMSGADLNAPPAGLAEMVARYNASQDEVELVIATASEYFQAQSADGLQEREGDLNPVFTGCYTARISIKQRNRELENKLATVEKLQALEWVEEGTSPASLDAAWEPVLFNQFHDLICGSHLDPAYENTMQRFAQADYLASVETAGRLERLAARIDTRGEGIPLVVFNPLAGERTDVARTRIGLSDARWDSLALYDEEGNRVALQLDELQRYPDGSIKRADLLFIACVPSLGYRTYWLRPGGGKTPHTDLWVDPPFSGGQGIVTGNLRPDDGRLGNSLVEVHGNLRTGAIRSLVLRDLGWNIVDGRHEHDFGCICRQEDQGDPWEYYGPLRGGITSTYPLNDPVPPRGQATFSYQFGGVGWVRGGPVMAEMRVDGPFGDGRLGTRVRLYAGLPRVELDTELINRTRFVRYRKVFPFNLKDPRITYEIPFGALDRPEGEYPAQNWVDVSDGERGVALLNRGIPGHSLAGNVLTASLLKCVQVVAYHGGGYSEETKDVAGFEIGVEHRFEHALLPHRGDWKGARLYREGLAFNVPLIVQKTTAHASSREGAGSLLSRGSFMALEGEDLLLHAMYAGQDELVLRVAEAAGNRAAGRITLGWPIAAVRQTDFIDATSEPLSADRNSFRFQARPFEVKTFRVRLAAPASPRFSPNNWTQPTR